MSNASSDSVALAEGIIIVPPEESYRTSFPVRCEILSWFFTVHGSDPKWAEFFDEFDMGVPLSVLVYHGGAVPTRDGVLYANQTWMEFCSELGVDPFGEYATMSQMMGLSTAS